jgi:D-alanyl-D-alanine carboxypeptidase (penicillin-binding protein 5/6)
MMNRRNWRSDAERQGARSVAVLLLVLACLPIFAAPALGAATEEISLTSQAAILMDYASGKVLYEKNAHTPLPPASVTKIMTLVLALEAYRDGKITLDTMVPTSELAASMGGTQIWLEPGEQMSVQDLLYAIAVGSANDAAVAVGEYLGGSEPGFVALMNAKAKALGMKNTRFANPSGLPPDDVGKSEPHHSSAYDLAVLSRYAMGLPMFQQLVSTWGPVLMRAEGKKQPELWSFNKMMKQYRGMDGIKTGMTNEAGFCLSATAERDHLRLIAVTLNAPTSKERNADVARLLDHGFAQLRAVKVAVAGEKVGEVVVSKGRSEKVAVTPADDVVFTVERTEQVETSTEIISSTRVVAPVKKGQAVAEMVVKAGDRELARADLLAMEDVERGSLLQIMVRTVRQITGTGPK